MIHVILLDGEGISEDGIKRIVSEEINRAIKEMDNPRLKQSEAIHEVRKLRPKRKPCQYRVALCHVERTQQNPYGLVVSSVDQNEIQADLS